MNTDNHLSCYNNVVRPLPTLLLVLIRNIFNSFLTSLQNRDIFVVIFL
jgi:hypothetical protein